MKWKEHLLKNITKNALNLTYYLDKGIDIDSCGVHLAVFNEPFLSLLLNGQKTMESRFSINKVSPFQKVKRNDIVLVKKSGGAICGFFIVGKVHYFQNTENNLNDIKRMYSKEICSSAVSDFWQERTKTKFISLLEVKKVKTLPPMEIDKRDRMAWVVLRQSVLGTALKI